ncbi:hypothetical protein COOONC_16970, partial [Cooperia oncophora]
DSKEKTKKGGRGESDDEDDDTIEEEQTADEVVESEPAWIRLVNGNSPDEKQLRQSKSSAVLAPQFQERPLLATGLQFAKEIYGLGRVGPSPEMRTLYENYVNSGCYKFDAEDWVKYKPTLLTDLTIPTAQPAADRRPALFTVDDIFKTCPPEVSKSSLKFYQDSFVGVNDYFSKKNTAAFSEYPSIF